MSKKQEGDRIPVTKIQIDLASRTIIFEGDGQPLARLTLAAEGVIFFQPGLDLGEISSPEVPVESEPKSSKENNPTQTLTGRLKNQPRGGKPDRSGRPTAYARFAAHLENEDEAHDYIATFHRHTAKIALNLAKDAQITVEGYPHPSASEKRLETFSVINLRNYPGMPKKR
jgi:hypothetical protein